VAVHKRGLTSFVLSYDDYRNATFPLTPQTCGNDLCLKNVVRKHVRPLSRVNVLRLAVS